MLSLILVINFAFVLASDKVPTITVDNGNLEGYFLKTVKGREYAAFEGIPYAKPPVDELRFEPPQPKEPWTGTLKATEKRKCLQYVEADPTYVTGNEDCLYVNVYKPKEDVKNLDVIVYIHGGGFMFNHGGDRSDYIMDKDVIFVTLHYRLGPLGFMSTQDPILPGNNGLKDQNLALKWIKQNIHHFGGNPESITIVGMSAGGASVHFHTISPLSEGLFSKAISQSGVAVNPWVITDKSRQKAFQMGALLKCPTGNSKEMVQCLKTRPGHQIVNSVRHFQVWLYNPFTTFGPVVDKYSKNPFLPEHPIALMHHKKMADVPMIFSFVECEGLYPAADFGWSPQYVEHLNSNWNEIASYLLDFNDTLVKEQHNEISKKIRRAYYKDDEDITMGTFRPLIDMLSDRIFLKGINEVAQIYASFLSSPVYMYKFSYLGKYSTPHTVGINYDYGCTCHGDDTLYVMPSSKDMRSTENDAKMSDLLIDIWVSFAKNGEPKVKDVVWPPLPKMQRKTIDYLHIASPENIKYESFGNLGNTEFWDTIPLQENINLFKKKDEL